MNCTHSQRRMCTPCSEQVVCLINKLLNTTQTKNAFCKIKVMGHCALKSKQSWDNRLTDPGDRSYLLPSQLSIYFLFFIFSCWALLKGDYLTQSLTLLERWEGRRNHDNLQVGKQEFTCMTCLVCASERERETDISQSIYRKDESALTIKQSEENTMVHKRNRRGGKLRTKQRWKCKRWQNRKENISHGPIKTLKKMK